MDSALPGALAGLHKLACINKGESARIAQCTCCKQMLVDCSKNPAGLPQCIILTTIPAAAIPLHTDPSRLAAESICVPTWKFCTNRMCSTSTKTEARQAKLKLIGL